MLAGQNRFSDFAAQDWPALLNLSAAPPLDIFIHSPANLRWLMDNREDKDVIITLMCAEFLRIFPSPGRCPTAVNGPMLTRIDGRMSPGQCLYYQLIALGLQGRKRAFYRGREISCGSGGYCGCEFIKCQVFLSKKRFSAPNKGSFSLES